MRRHQLTERQLLIYDKLLKAVQDAKRQHDLFLETVAAATDWPMGTNIYVKDGALIGDDTVTSDEPPT